MGMTVNTYKTKVMIIKSSKITYDTFIYDNCWITERGGESVIEQFNPF
jgi:hypothetical protein